MKTFSGGLKKLNLSFYLDVLQIMDTMEDMTGKWKLESRDSNFDKFLQCREVGWFLRKLMTSSVADVEYKLSADRGTFTKITSTYGGTSHYPMPTEGEFCPKKTLSGRVEVGRIFSSSGGNLIQEMRFADSDEIAAVIKHKVEDGKLLVDMQCRDILCRAIYVKH